MKRGLVNRFIVYLPILALLTSAADAVAKKPVPEPPDNSCRVDQFEPNYVFYRSTGDRKNPTATFYLAESTTGCEKEFLVFPALGENGSRIDVRYLKFSSFLEGTETFGRVVWRSNLTGIEENIWSQDFHISGPDVTLDGDIRLVLVNRSYWNQSINQFDLSPDTSTLAYKLFNEDPVTGEHVYSIRIIDIDYCHVQQSGCLFDDESAVVLAQTEPEVEFDHYLSHPAWGPLGTRVYFKKSEDFPVLQYAVFDEDWQFPSPSFEVIELYSSEFEPEFQRMRGMASGVLGEDEYLAVEFVHETVNCGYIYFLNVEECENSGNPICFTDVEFTGTNPSWTKAGEVIHHYYDPKVNRRSCSVYGGKVGVYDGNDVTPLTDGLYPDGSGG